MDILLVTAQEEKHEPSCSVESGSSMYCAPPLPFLKLLRWLILPRIASEQDEVKGPIHSVGHPTSPAEGKKKENRYDSKMVIKLKPVHLKQNA